MPGLGRARCFCLGLKGRTCSCLERARLGRGPAAARRRQASQLALLRWLRLHSHGAQEDVVQRPAGSRWSEGGRGLERLALRDVPVVEAGVLTKGE